ncbi:MAG: GIY-YIG nuclease family protein [Verrucomicrobiaceae bacterium]|nr:MAG: GIY-YIG nuclease family protein [Verrucomicrobiaceae bacterium]
METFIYVISGDMAGPCKIGFSNNPEKRLRQLQTGHPAKLFLHHTQGFPEDRARLMEQIIHKTIRPFRLKGEWFKIDVASAIAEIEFALIRYGDEPNLRYFV